MPEAQDDSRPPGTVVRVLEDGYTINDRLLRPARVVVAGNSRRETNSRSDAHAPRLVPEQNTQHDALTDRDAQSGSDRARNRRGR
jgi:GrpE protein